VIQLGDHGHSMFVLWEGLLEVRIAVKEGQAERRVARLQAGMFFGEMSVLTGEARSALVVAVTDALVFEISKDHIASLISRRPELAEQIARVVTARKLRNSEAVAAANSADPETEKISMTAQLVGKMLAFFGLKTKIASFARLERVKEIESS
jgi:CRP-like cAMP-binding protein